MKHIKVVAAIIMHNNKILCVQRPEGKFSYISNKWEFPGGKVEQNESDHDALLREIKEELSIELNDTNFYIKVNHQFPDFDLDMFTYICNVSNDFLVRREHIDHKWLHVIDMVHLDWAEADIPIVKKLVEDYHEF